MLSEPSLFFFLLDWTGRCDVVNICQRLTWRPLEIHCQQSGRSEENEGRSKSKLWVRASYLWFRNLCSSVMGEELTLFTPLFTNQKFLLTVHSLPPVSSGVNHHYYSGRLNENPSDPSVEPFPSYPLFPGHSSFVLGRHTKWTDWICMRITESQLPKAGLDNCHKKSSRSSFCLVGKPRKFLRRHIWWHTRNENISLFSSSLNLLISPGKALTSAGSVGQAGCGLLVLLTPPDGSYYSDHRLLRPSHVLRHKALFQFK